tara:strand:- start:1529 stop:1975 length:447 start_codon:yes stop_codon:yes gene_type:complete
MRLYPNIEIDKDKLLGSEQCKNSKISIKKENILLTKFGMYKYVNKNLCIFKLNGIGVDSILLKNFVNDHNFIKSEDLWKRVDNINVLPFNHIKLSVTTYTHTLPTSSNIKFIVEVYDNSKIDFYFKTPEELDNPFLKKDIGLFLKNLK